MRLRLMLAVLSVAALLPMSAARAAVPVLVVEGRGFGHGVGMAQDGALAMGRAGSTTAQILGHFYPGTAIGRSTGEVRVAVHTAADGHSEIAFPYGGEIRDARTGAQSTGFPVRVKPGATVRVRWDGERYRVEGAAVGAAAASPADASPPATMQAAQLTPTSTTSTTSSPLPTSTTSTTASPATTSTTTASSSTTSAPRRDERSGPSSARPLWAVADGGIVDVPARGRRYRGAIQATASGTALRLINAVDVEAYLKGMGEVRDPSWPAASLRAQAIAARTYAMRAMATSGELCDTQRCQVYLGATAEYHAMNRAVNDTAGQVLTYGKRLVSAVYSANGGGYSASREEGFGTTGAGYPYLRPVPYRTGDPLPWTVRASLADVATRLGYTGELTGVTVAAVGPSGRALQVQLDGGAGPKVVTGIAFDRALGLRSTLFSLRTELAEVAPPALGKPEVEVQGLPEDAAPADAMAGSTALIEPTDVPGIPTTGRSAALGFATPRDVHPLAVVLAALALGAVALGTGASAGAAGLPRRRRRAAP